MCKRRAGNLPAEPLTYDHAREHRDHDTNAECDGEATDDACPDKEENATRDECGDVAISDARPCFVETCVNSGTERLTTAEFLFHAFEGEHVGIDCHTHTKDDTGDPRKCEYHMLIRNEEEWELGRGNEKNDVEE